MVAKIEINAVMRNEIAQRRQMEGESRKSKQKRPIFQAILVNTLEKWLRAPRNLEATNGIIPPVVKEGIGRVKDLGKEHNLD